MAVDRMGSPQEASEAARLGTAEMIDRLSRFDGPPEHFLVNLLATQCQLADADGGAILRPGNNRRAEVVAVYPPLVQGTTPPVWLAQAVESATTAMSSETTVCSVENIKP